MTKEQLHLYPLTSSQREIWFDQMLHAEVPLYNIGGYVKIPGQIDPLLFEQAINLLVQKHDALRTVLTETKDEDGLPLQSFSEDLSVSVPVQDLSEHDDAEQAALAWMQTRFNEPFQLIGQLLFRYDLVKTSEECYYVQGQQPDLEAHSYMYYISDDRAYVESDKFEEQHHYWLDKYPTAPEPLLKKHKKKIA